MFTQDDNQSQVSGGSNNNQNQADSQSASDVITTPPTQDSTDNTQVDQLAQADSNDQADYVDSYTPPAQTTAQVKEDDAPQDQPISQPSTADTENALKELEELMKRTQEKREPQSNQDQTAQASGDDQSQLPADSLSATLDPVNVDDSLVSPKMTMPASVQAQTPAVDTQELADQNIFFLLGAEDGSMEEQEQFLDELQQTVWDDFVSNDMALLITSDEKIKADEILNNSQLDEMNKQEELLNYLDGLVPDLEEIMLEKALKLKEDLVRERVASYRESFAQDQVKLQQLQEIEQLMTQKQWKTVGEKLNQIE